MEPRFTVYVLVVEDTEANAEAIGNLGCVVIESTVFDTEGEAIRAAGIAGKMVFSVYNGTL